jgi:hypothetical protein
MPLRKNVSIVSLIESRQIHSTPLSLTVQRASFSPSLLFSLRTIQTQKRVVSVLQRKETLARNETQRNFYRRLRMAMISGSMRFLPHEVVPTPSEDGKYTSFVIMSVHTWDANTLIAFT